MVPPAGLFNKRKHYQSLSRQNYHSHSKYDQQEKTLKDHYKDLYVLLKNPSHSLLKTSPFYRERKEPVLEFSNGTKKKLFNKKKHYQALSRQNYHSHSKYDQQEKTLKDHYKDLYVLLKNPSHSLLKTSPFYRERKVPVLEFSNGTKKKLFNKKKHNPFSYNNSDVINNIAKKNF